MELKGTKSATLMCGALLASVLGTTEVAQADPTDILIGTALNGASGASAVHTFGGAPTTYGALSPYFITVSSGDSDREGWQYEVQFDLSAFDVGFLGPSAIFSISMIIKDDATSRPISAVNVKDVNGNDIEFITAPDLPDGFGNGDIFLGVFAGDIDLGDGNPTNDIVTVQWNQVPAPAAFALLGLGGLVGSRRRRG